MDKIKLNELENLINHYNELDLKGDLNDEDYEKLKNIKKEYFKEKQKFMPKQVIVIRKDLNMPAGKLAAQVAHASWGMFSQNFEFIKTENGYKVEIEFNENNKFHQASKIWFEERFTKVILYVKSEEKLKEIYNKACKKGLPVCFIEDAGFTVFNEPTITCIGIGPAFSEDLIGVTDKLQIFKD